ncbi:MULTISPECIES: CbtA family protein [Burkholderia]|uniref:Putative cobalt transporter subunit CbtA n=1 Tax=Burkholderia pyrrocinia TaxID=60550 RepID=A0A318IAD9_BURPY|nr:MULTISPECIES: CbtA family protein [Burkholderia]PXX28709.1 putative cobalt transporter subunit CbtA [Burkholderia pyrrocinia]SFW84294.1 Probable cobalt transporter subunit (CbtA) [Burkholderia sp. NFACC33-1]SFY45144.1 Probable cobalt transporter subunit (CbtA) [Burkholderia sp. NFPP32]
MVGKLLMRGMLAGIAAGLLTFGFAKIVGEPQVDQAISFEEKLEAAKGDAPEHEHELVSRDTQAGLGLLTGVVTYGAAFGGLFSLVFAYAYGRGGRLPARPLAAWLALAAFVALVIVPNIKYPANPPSVGDPDTIGYRTGLFFLMIAISIATMAFSVSVRRHLLATLGQWNASIVAGLVFIAIIAAVQFGLPSINEVPAAFPAAVLWKFRIAAIGMQAIMWTTIGLLFGAWVERDERIGMRAA